LGGLGQGLIEELGQKEANGKRILVADWMLLVLRNRSARPSRATLNFRYGVSLKPTGHVSTGRLGTDCVNETSVEGWIPPGRRAPTGIS